MYTKYIQYIKKAYTCRCSCNLVDKEWSIILLTFNNIINSYIVAVNLMVEGTTIPKRNH